ncbi:MAG: beta-N-acetylhexosaminidase [Bacteroidota bacterium]
MKKYTVLWFIIIITMISHTAKSQSKDLAILPQPFELTPQKGVFKITEKTIIVVNNQQTSGHDAEIFNQYLSQYYGMSLQVSQNRQTKGKVIKLIDNPGLLLPDDAYRLHITPDSIRIEGKGSGVFYALQTLRQLLPDVKSETLDIPCASIYDYPQFQWRGMHLDVCRHFFTPIEVKKYIDLIAFYKMNVFHWHLTDDQGWRIMIDKYPKLTSVGGYRNGTLIGHYQTNPQTFDSIHYGGYYTKEDIRDIVKYASDRHVLVVPEIEMPGHALAALAAYPQLSCTGGQFQVSKLWGVFDDVYCTKDSTINFLKDVLAEVMDLFPGKYIHIGGDECPKTRWKVCPRCQAVMQREGLKDENELQSYVVRTIEKFVNSKGKTIIGWDEILDGGLAPNAVVMSWRGNQGGVAAAKLNHNVVMCPGQYCYFDHYQGNPSTEPLAIGGNTTLEKVYSFNPIPQELTPEQKHYILGAQGNVWTEYIPDYKKVEYMAMPRMIALSEVLWIPSDKKNYTDFLSRLKKHMTLLDMMGVNYSKTQ